MVYFLLFLSFLIHIVMAIFIKSMRDRLDEIQEIEATQEKNKKEIEDLLAVYLVEIKEENDKLISKLNETSQNKEQIVKENKPKQVDRNEANKKQYQKDTVEGSYEKSNQKELLTSDNNYTPPLTNQKEDIVEQSVYARVYSLFDQGKSIDTIARELKLGKTEVELMLKFNRKNS